MASLTVTPRYGRDYKNKKDAMADWEAGKDFTSCAMDSYGLAVNIEDARDAMFERVTIRYKKSTQATVWYASNPANQREIASRK